MKFRSPIRPARRCATCGERLHALPARRPPRSAHRPATSDTLQAGATTGAYQVIVSVEGVTTTSAVFDLDNLDAGTPVLTLQAVSGGGQLATVGQTFANTLRVKLADSQGAGIAGRLITFTLPVQWRQRLVWGGALQYQVQTDANGFANSPSLVANNVEGPFVAVVAAAGAADPVQFEHHQLPLRLYSTCRPYLAGGNRPLLAGHSPTRFG